MARNKKPVLTKSVAWSAVESNSVGCRMCKAWLNIHKIEMNQAFADCECGFQEWRPLKVKDVA